MSQIEVLSEIVQNVPKERLEEILKLRGVASEFIEFDGNVAQIPLESRLAVLAALGVDNDQLVDIEGVIKKTADAAWVKWVGPTILVNAGQYSLRIASQETEVTQPLSWQITLENGEKMQGCFDLESTEVKETYHSAGINYQARNLVIPELPLGYHQLTLKNSERQQDSLMIVAPTRVFEPEWLAQEKGIWGISLQLFSLCSERNWGIGDFSDLHDLVGLAKEHGADFLLLNPLHALDIQYPENASPYSPIDRRYLNPLYIDPSIEDDFIQSDDVQRYIEEESYQLQKHALQKMSDVNYPEVCTFKNKIYDLMFSYFKRHHLRENSARAQDFKNFIDSNDESILSFANYQADIDLPDIICCHDPEFHLYLQWIAHRQLDECQNFAIENGMAVGIIRDLAVGSGSESCEVKTNRDLFCLDARIGAPPDNFNPDGQNWGLAPMRPDVLQETGFSHYIDLLRENMAHCGALRIDHVLALMRLWWCPLDDSQGAGAYVYYPVNELFAILRLESQRAKCVIIGEDLGVVPPEIRAHIDDSGILSNIVFYFEKHEGCYFKMPEHYASKALAIVANHDVPTLKGWWNLDDLVLRRSLDLIVDDEQLTIAKDERNDEKHKLLHWLNEQGMLPELWQDRHIGREFDFSLCGAIFRACATAQSLMVSVQLDDIAGLDTPVNIPGTSDEYPNWRRKIMTPVNTLLLEENTKILLAGMQQERS